jgi:PhnB protein
MSDSDLRSRITATPYLCCADASSAIEFYKAAFGAEETMRIPDPSGKVSHAEMSIDGAAIYVSDEYPEIGVLSPQTIGGSPVMIVLDTPDVDSLFNRAVGAGAAIDRPLQDGFDGALRTGKLLDPSGHRWMLVTKRGEVKV